MLVALACGCGGGGGGGNQGAPPDTTAPQISGATATPSSLEPLKEDLTIGATVTDDVGVTSVEAKITKPDATTEKVMLTVTAGTTTFTGKWLAVAGTARAAGTYTVEITAKDAANNAATPVKVTFTVGPPQPPSA